jgi:hypothetical protein
MNDRSSISLNAVWILVVRVVQNFVVVFDSIVQKKKRMNPQNKDPPLTLPRLRLTQSCPQQTLRHKRQI